MSILRKSFLPGIKWPDNNGVHINAHGGGLLYHDGVYYWFGEHKIEGQAGNRAHVGVHCYASRDLYNWNDAGIALAVANDPASPIVKGCVIERPKVIFNRLTGKFVMWFHLEKAELPTYEAALAGVALADRVTGPYTFLHAMRPNAGHWPINARADQKSAKSIRQAREAAALLPEGKRLAPQDANVLGCDFAGGQQSRDQTVFADDDGTAYHIYSSENNSALHIARLNPDYCSHSGEYVREFEMRRMEAAAPFRHANAYYLLMSGCSGWAPNTARLASAPALFGPWTELGNPCKGINPHNGLGPDLTFGGQSCYVLPVHGRKNAFIAMLDIWTPGNAIDGLYVWLPIIFKNGTPVIEWKSEWDLSVFD